jgi:hypothetical protein
MDYNSFCWLMQEALNDSSIRSQPSVTDVLRCISDSKALSLFKAVAISDYDHNSKIFITQLGLSRRQYYSNMGKLMGASLVRRVSGKHRLTSLGKVMFSCILKIEMSIKYYWKLKAIDSITTTTEVKGLPAREYEIIVKDLIDNDEIKTLLISNNRLGSFQSSAYSMITGRIRNKIL